MSMRAFFGSLLFCCAGILITVYIDLTYPTTPVSQPSNMNSSAQTYGATTINNTPATTTTDTSFTHPPLLTYVEITNSCSITVSDTCFFAHSQPSHTSTTRQALRNGMVLLVDETITAEDGSQWHRIAFNEPLRYAERLQLPWYIPVEAGETFQDPGILHHTADTPTTSKRIIVERGAQMLYAYEGDELFMATSTATGLFATPTPRGHFTVFTKTPTRYMQGPIPGITSQYYDLPGVPWNLYFTAQGAIVHGVYWHDTFGTPYSNGCVNLPPNLARELYHWADVGMSLVVRD